jgi:serine/threonine-protein kinase SRPK3
MMVSSKVESESAYGYGGLHPVTLGESLGLNNRYCILHKLGHNKTSTIWLAKDNLTKVHTYIALRIVAAQTSNSVYAELAVKKRLAACQISTERAAKFSLHMDAFIIEGINGEHLCLTYPLHGPIITLGVFGPQDPGPILRRACYDLVAAVNVLHTNGIIHGSNFNSPLQAVSKTNKT